MRVYTYNIFEDDKGVIIANSYEEAVEVFNKEFPNVKVVPLGDVDGYWNGGCVIEDYGGVYDGMMCSVYLD